SSHVAFLVQQRAPEGVNHWIGPAFAGFLAHEKRIGKTLQCRVDITGSSKCLREERLIVRASETCTLFTESSESMLDFFHSRLRVAGFGTSRAVDDRGPCEVVTESILTAQSRAFVGLLRRDGGFAAELVKHRRVIECQCDAERMRQSFSAFERQAAAMCRLFG